jgi:hypothetical protein
LAHSRPLDETNGCGYGSLRHRGAQARTLEAFLVLRLVAVGDTSPLLVCNTLSSGVLVLWVMHSCGPILANTALHDVVGFPSVLRTVTGDEDDEPLAQAQLARKARSLED